jgi:threonylcarbamoyladenosine tRNA methylthiotransferase MtaB
VKAQEGCDNFCTYCIVPLVRGREKSLPAEEVIREINRKAADGYQEGVLTGTEIGRYNSSGMNLKGLLELILAQTPISRLRLSSVQPQEISPDLLKLWQNLRLCRHFHLSLQSGSDGVLQRMGRRYTASQYAEMVSLIRQELPEAAITTDIITGFPGETDREFQESLDFCRQIGFARMHVFPYSPRADTRAALMPDQISPRVKKSRSEKMLVLAKTSLLNYHSCFLGSVQAVLFEQPSGGFWSGLTGTYIKVYARSRDDLTNQIRLVRLVELKGDGVLGEVEVP